MTNQHLSIKKGSQCNEDIKNSRRRVHAIVWTNLLRNEVALLLTKSFWRGVLAKQSGI